MSSPHQLKKQNEECLKEKRGNSVQHIFEENDFQMKHNITQLAPCLGSGLRKRKERKVLCEKELYSYISYCLLLLLVLMLMLMLGLRLLFSFISSHLISSHRIHYTHNHFGRYEYIYFKFECLIIIILLLNMCFICDLIVLIKWNAREYFNEFFSLNSFLFWFAPPNKSPAWLHIFQLCTSSICGK